MGQFKTIVDMAYFRPGLTSGTMEAVNGLIQSAKRAARGYRSFTNLRAMAYWKAGGLHLNLPPLLST